MLKRLLILIPLVLTACSPSVQFVGDNSEFTGPDPAGGKKELLYDKKSVGNLDIFANAVHEGTGNIEGGYRVNLYLVNNGKKEITVTPEMILKSERGVELRPLDYFSFMNLAYKLQNTVPPKAPTYRNDDRRLSGTAFDQYGNYYTFNATTATRLSGAEQFNRGFEQGYAAGEALVAIATVRAGRKLSNWGEDYYIRPKYKISPNGKILATAYFKKLKPIKENLTLLIKLGEKTVEF